MSDEFDLDAGVDAVADGWLGEEQTDNIDDIIDNAEPEEVTEEVAEEVAEEVTEEITAKAPPASWGKEHHEKWSAIPVETQEYIELREKQMLDGIEQYKEGYKLASEISKTIEPFYNTIQEQGLDPKEAIHNLFAHNEVLTKGPIESRKEAFYNLGVNLGLITPQGQAPIDPRTNELQQRLDRIERENQQRAQMEYQSRYQITEKEVADFAAKNEYFNEVADDVLRLLQTGLDLQSAYGHAVWVNPITRDKMIQSKEAERLEAKRKEAEAAKKSKSVNVRSAKRDVETSDPLGSWEHTMRQHLERTRQ